MPVRTLPIETLSAERTRRAQKAQHITAAIILIAAAWGHISSGHVRVLAVLEIAAGLLLVASVIAERLRGHSRHGIAWVEFAGAGMVLVEAFAKLEERHHFLFYVLAFVQPLALLTFAIFDVRIQSLRRLTSDDDGFEIRTRTFFGRRVRWADVHAWQTTAKAIEVTMRDGRGKRLSFRNVKNRGEALQWAAAEFTRHAGSASEELPGGERQTEQSEGDQRLVPLDDRTK